MKLKIELWEEFSINVIPVGKYCTEIINSEERGLSIKLENSEYIVNIVYGVVSGFRVFDEGILLSQIFNEEEIKKYKKNNFANTIYKIKNGEFSELIKKVSNELYDYLNFKHYLIVTMNYVIEIISEWEPTIEVIKK